MKSYKQYYRIKAELQDVYACLTNPITIELWSGYPAKFKPEPDTEFELWDGDIIGKVLEIEPEQKLVQQWYFEGQEEESIVTIKLHPSPKEISVELRHENIPEEVYEEFVDGWDIHFFGAIKAFLEE